MITWKNIFLHLQLQDTVVAVKRFHARNPSSVVNSRQEISNLSVLKESITRHRYIRTHLAALFHKGEHIILLPWADRYDLHHFLLEGHDQWGNQVYNFETVFDCHSRHFVRDTYKQIANIAAALKWLHEDVRPLDKRMYFAHMDLKPDNILIDNDSPQHPSAVGKWVLTDFGISAFKETDEKEGKSYVTVRDYVEQKQNLTLNTHARREAGAYQPPEMERLSQAADGSSNTPLQRVVGRRSDIWSFGCIFAEVVAFSSGRRAAVSDFRDARRGTHNDDYFYTYRQLSSSNLSPGVSGHTPELRPEMVAWLMNMTDNLATPTMAHGVLKCSVAKVFDILKIDQRPGAEEVRQAMEHLTSHFNCGFRPGPNCAVQGLHPPIRSAPARPPAAHPPPRQTPPPQSPHTQTTPAQPSPAQDPTATAQVPPQIIVRAHTADAGTVTHTGRTEVEDTPPDDPSPESEAVDLPLNDDPGFAPPRRVESDELYADPDIQNTNTGTGRDNAIQPNQPQDQLERPVLSPRPSTTDSGYHSVLRTPGTAKATYGVQTPDTKILRIALCSSGRFVATITKPSKISLKSPKYTICCHQISPTDLGVLPHFSEPLPKANSWDNVSVHSDLIAAWGDNTKGVKQVSNTVNC
jgi:serine/threonine protein kinase